MKIAPFLAAATALLLIAAGPAVIDNSNPQPTVQTSFFPSTIVNDILDQRECVGIRFYNAVYPGGTAESSMAIGIKGDGSEIYNGLWPKTKYQYFVGIEGNSAEINPLNKSNAINACENLGETPKFNATFTSSEMAAILAVSGTTGVRIVETTSGENKSFEASSAKLASGEIQLVDQAVSTVSSDPCPSMCGSMNNYVCTDG